MRAFDEAGDPVVIEDARGADLGTEGRDACLDERVVQYAGIGRIIEDLADGIEIQHRPDLGDAHFADVEIRDPETGRPGVEIDRDSRHWAAAGG